MDDLARICDRSAEQARFVDRLRRLVRDDLAAQRLRLNQIWQLPLDERVRRGKAIANVHFMGFQDDGAIRLHCPQNESLFREGDVLCLHRDNPQTHPSCTVTLEYEDDEQVIVSPVHGCDIEPDLEETPDGWILDFGLFDLSERYHKAFDEAAQSRVGRDAVLPLLMNQIQPQLDPERREFADLLAKAFGLNWSQTEALTSAYAADTFYLVQGPPGTGKTWLLAYLVKALVENGQPVLVTGLTHRAINNALNKIRQVAPELPLAKIGIRAQSWDLKGVENYEKFTDTPFAREIGRGYAIGATPFAARSTRLQDVDFDCVIFDEASQVTLPLALMGMLSGSRYIFIGDDKQLPPVFSARPEHPELAQSIFELLLPRGAVTMLDETYRLNDELTRWPSERFYNGLLTSHETAAPRRLTLQQPPERYQQILDPRVPAVFVQTLSVDTTTRCPRSAEIVTELVVELIRCGLPASEIAIVTPYRAQARLVRTMLRRAVGEQVRQIVTDTVERMQGQEREVVLFSNVTADPDFAATVGEFLFDPRRLNVSITRARTKLIVVGSRRLLEAMVDEEAQEGLDALADLLDNCTCLDWED